jgi:hypothetical protein
VYPPQRVKQTHVFTGDAKQIAKQLVDKLKSEARVL